MLQKSFFKVSWKSILQPWQEVDWWLFILPIGLTVFGGIMIRSAELNYGWTDWRQHWIAGGVGLFLAVVLARTRYEFLARWHWVTYALTNISLLAVLFIGTTALGAQRWIPIGGFYVQPSEFAKIGVIITLAALLQANPNPTLFSLAKVLGVVGVPWALIFIQPDLGTSLVFGAIALGMLYWGNVNLGWIILMCSPLVSAILFNIFLSNWLIGIAILWVILMGVIAWMTLPWNWIGAMGAMVINLVAGELGHILWGLLKDYQKDRLILFLNPDKDPLGGGYHLIQSRIAIGAGQLWGRGLHKGTQTQLNFIPEQHTDFIFSAIGEEFGFIGSMLLLLAFWLVCLRLLIIAQNAKDDFGSLLTIGVLSMLIFQIVINIGMTIGLAPVTGIPLPWLSYARSGMLTNWIAIGLVQSVSNYRQRFKY